MAFDKKLLDILACPSCKGKLIYKADDSALICKFDRLRFPIRENIPVLLESEAQNMTSDEIEKIGN